MQNNDFSTVRHAFVRFTFRRTKTKSVHSKGRSRTRTQSIGLELHLYDGYKVCALKGYEFFTEVPLLLGTLAVELFQKSLILKPTLIFSPGRISEIRVKWALTKRCNCNSYPHIIRSIIIRSSGNYTYKLYL